MKIHTRLRHGAALTTVLALGMLGACSSGGDASEDRPPVSDYWRIQIDEARASERASDFTKSVLEDYWVSDAETREAEQQYLSSIVYFYGEMRSNPEGKTLTERRLDCLREYGVTGWERLDDEAVIVWMFDLADWQRPGGPDPIMAHCVAGPTSYSSRPEVGGG